MAEKKLEDYKTGAILGGIVGVGAAFIASPLVLIAGPRGGGEILKGIVEGCSKAGAYVEKEITK